MDSNARVMFMGQGMAYVAQQSLKALRGQAPIIRLTTIEEREQVEETIRLLGRIQEREETPNE